MVVITSEADIEVLGVWGKRENVILSLQLKRLEEKQQNGLGLTDSER